ncbi:MAG: hypothetical protein K2H64_05960 [Desulfovibrio sp.]|nr:hypothetical protein [Desulfovibrio sp.]
MNNVAEIYDKGPFVKAAKENFAAILDNADYATVMEYMGIGRFQFLLRKQMIAELGGLYTALWRLALGRSLPNEADEMFADFLAEYERTHSGKYGALVAERAAQYWEMMGPEGDSDFRNVAQHLISFVVKDQRDSKALTLKLALHIRAMHRTIFERLY